MYHAKSTGDFPIEGEDLASAVKNNLASIAKDLRIGNLFGYKVLDIYMEYTDNIVDGQGGAHLVIRAKGIKLPNASDGKEKEYTAYVYCDPSEINGKQIIELN